MIINLLDLIMEIVKIALPSDLIFAFEDISREAFKFSDLISNFVSFQIDGVWNSCNCFQISAKDGVEFLNDDARILEISQHFDHVLRGAEDFLSRLKVPSLHCQLTLDISSG
jgi:hypothetical protein